MNIVDRNVREERLENWIQLYYELELTISSRRKVRNLKLLKSLFTLIDQNGFPKRENFLHRKRRCELNLWAKHVVKVSAWVLYKPVIHFRIRMYTYSGTLICFQFARILRHLLFKTRSSDFIEVSIMKLLPLFTVFLFLSFYSSNAENRPRKSLTRRL